jgi:chromosome segregation and condensation protein ScpB
MTPKEAEIKRLGGEGILTIKDINDFTEAKRELYKAFAMGRELSVPEMRELTGQDQADRRMRDLRADLKPRGYDIIRVPKGGRTYKYKLARLQGELL